MARSWAKGNLPASTKCEALRLSSFSLIWTISARRRRANARSTVSRAIWRQRISFACSRLWPSALTSGDRCATICAVRADRWGGTLPGKHVSMKTQCCVAGLAAALASPAASQTALPLVPFNVVVVAGVAAIPAPLTGKLGDAKEGGKVVAERRLGYCLSCHEIE